MLHMLAEVSRKHPLPSYRVKKWLIYTYQSFYPPRLLSFKYASDNNSHLSRINQQYHWYPWLAPSAWSKFRHQHLRHARLCKVTDWGTKAYVCQLGKKFRSYTTYQTKMSIWTTNALQLQEDWHVGIVSNPAFWPPRWPWPPRLRWLRAAIRLIFPRKFKKR